MTFLNQSLLFGAAALAIPLVIHILNRSRFRTVEWGAMHLLESVIQANRKRFRIDQLILLLIRCAIPVLLAFCLSRPVLTGANPLEGDAPVSMVILLDNSYSMDVADASGTRLEQAVDAAISIISAAGRGSEISVIQTGGRPTPLFDQPIFDADAVIRRLQQVEGGFGSSDFEEALQVALITLTSMTHARRELIVLTDFQSADWKDLDANAIRDQVAAADFPAEVTLLKVGTPAEGNVSVESIEFPRRAIGVGQQLAVRANLRNHGDQNVENVRVGLLVDGVEETVSQLTLAAGGTSQVLFPIEFDSPGSHAIEVVLSTNDGLSTDNRYSAAVMVWDRLPVLLVDGDQSSQPLQSETDYLAIALTPFTFGRLNLTDLIETQTISAKQLDEPRLSASRVVMLANVSKLTDPQVGLLSEYVGNGRALFVSPGNRLDLSWYREQMFADGAGLLPLPFEVPKGGEGESPAVARIVSQRFDHAALSFFNAAENGDLSTAEINRWSKLVETAHSQPPADIIEEVASINVIARLDTGDPFLVEKPYGDGIVVQMATACDADWSTLPLRPVYVPLIQQLVTTMASRISPPRNLSTGTEAVALIDTRGEEALVSVEMPNGFRRMVTTIPQGKMQLARFSETQRPGLYRMSTPANETLHFAVEAPRTESELSSFTEVELDSLANGLGATVIESQADYLEQDRLRRNGREVWKLFLAGLLLFMILELVFQQRFARVHE